LEADRRLQIDLQPPMKITRVSQNGQELDYEKDGNAWFVSLPEQEVGSLQEIVVEYGGKPRVAPNAPWDGGLTWSSDNNDNPFIATSCQGEGASLWWPCKDHMYDEPDSMLISLTVPSGLVGVSNGRLRQADKPARGTQTFHWFVSNPINNYGVSINIGDYVHFSETYEGEKGPLDCDYYVLRDYLGKAKKHFQDVPRMLEAFEHWFGPYPFYEDGFKLVEVPFLGMEHQSAVAYGNGYRNGYRGYDLSGTGWGMKFDFIIIHEAGHEWFANSITYRDIADMWIHEGFTAYSESLYLDYHFGTEAANAYTRGTRLNIQNDRPIIGPYHVNKEGSGDMYYKGANMLLTLRQIVNDDDKWRSILRGLNETFYHQTVTTQQIEDYLADQADMELDGFFDQYLRTTEIPTLEYKLEPKGVQFRWVKVVDDFEIPIRVEVDGEEFWITPGTEFKRLVKKKDPESVILDPNFYVIPRQVE
jgi:aminopeptidase N